MRDAVEVNVHSHFNSCCVLRVSQEEFCSLWCDLQKDRPELLSVLEGILIHAVSHLQDSIRERDSLEQALRRCRLPPTVLEMWKTININYAVFNCEFYSLNSDFFSCFRRESEHDQVVRSIYEEMESQIREEREKRLTQVQTRAVWFRLFCHLTKTIIFIAFNQFTVKSRKVLDRSREGNSRRS